MTFSLANAAPWVTRAAVADVRTLADALDNLRLPGPGLPQERLDVALAYLRDNAESLVASASALAEAVDEAFAAFTDGGDAGPVVTAMVVIATQWRANSAAFQQFAQQLAVREIGYAVTGMDFDNYDQAVLTRNQIITALSSVEEAIADAGYDIVFAALIDVRVAITRMINGRAANLNPLVTYRAYAAPNSLTLAWRMYQDSDRDLEICQRLNARNPGFLPLTGRILGSDPL